MCAGVRVQALGLRADDTFSSQMLALALTEMAAEPAVENADSDDVSFFTSRGLAEQSIL